MHYYKFNIGDYRKDTTHLSTLEHGIYRQLIDWYYLEEKPIPRETDSVIRRLRLVSEDERNALVMVLREFFVEQSDGFHQLRCDEALQEYHKRKRTNKLNGKQGGRPKKTESVIDCNPNGSDFADIISAQKLGNFPETESVIFGNRNERQLTNSETKEISTTGKQSRKRSAVSKPPDVDQQVWDDFLVLRKAKRAPVTETVLKNLTQEASAAGWTLEDALQKMVAKGWQSFEASWVAKEAKSDTGSWEAAI
jgi:uncharacterized protein YdaU (DUF1376 family)